MPAREYYQYLSDLLASGVIFWQATVIGTEGSTPARPGMKLLIAPEQVFGNLGGGELEHLIISQIRQERPDRPAVHTYILSEQGSEALDAGSIPTSMICGGKVTVFWEPVVTDNPLYIIGAGHCGRALAQLAGLCGFQCVLLDNRVEILAAIPEQIRADRRLSDFTDLERHIRFGPNAQIVIMTHGHAHDRHVLEQCLGKPCAYLGMIGSARKVAATFKEMRSKGYSEAELSKVHAPIGLPIGSQTPYEIAVSILAELIQIRSNHRKP